MSTATPDRTGERNERQEVLRRSRAEDYRARLARARGDWNPPDYSQRILVTGERIAIASDVHLPYHDEKLLGRFLEDCDAFKVDAIVWLGDLMDMHLFSHWGRTDQTTLFPTELRIARSIIEMASEVAPVQYWSKGNHEDRFFRHNNNHVNLEMLSRMAGLDFLMESGQLIISDNPSLDALPDRFGHPTWLLTHPAQYGRQPLVVPGDLAGRFERNVVAAHAHHWGMGIDKTGKYTVIESGGLFEPKYHEYVQHHVTTHRAWTKGYWFLLGGRPMGFREE